MHWCVARQLSAEAFDEDNWTMSKAKELPDWIEEAGGLPAWRKWLTGKFRSCRKRASDWALRQRNPTIELPTAKEWRESIVTALHSSRGLGYYSQFPLTLRPQRETDWNWPSVDHQGSPASTSLVIETRLINDMKTIMSETEFLELIGHLASVHQVEVRARPSWSCQRSFAREQSPDEPPLPGLTEEENEC
jgi:hypothetical protein